MEALEVYEKVRECTCTSDDNDDDCDDASVHVYSGHVVGGINLAGKGLTLDQ